MELDAIDRRILTVLQRDGRISNSDLSGRVNLSESACLRRVRRLEAEGIIGDYVMLLNQAAIGRPTDIFVEITLTDQHEDTLDTFEAAVRETPEIMFCYLMSGDSDYLLHVVAADTADYERIHRTRVACLPGVSRIRSSFALRTVSRKTAFELI